MAEDIPSWITPEDIEADIAYTETFGDKVVGKKFNPSNRPDVDRVKEICAELIDMVHKSFDQVPVEPTQVILFEHTVGQILNAQMNAVKFLTLRS